MFSTAVCLLAAVYPFLSKATSTGLEHPDHLVHRHAVANNTLGPQPLNITTLAGNDRNESVIECWQVADLTVSNTPGIQGALFARLGTPTALNYVNIPPRFDGGLHNAPAVQ